MNLAVIPARGGSKGLPGKNLALVGGVSLVGRAVHAARMAEYIHEVVVSTDSDEIADEAIRAGATVHRREDNAGDFATSEEVLLQVIGSRPDVSLFAFIQCTSPFVQGAEIDACMHMLEREHLDCVFTVEETHSGYWVENPQGRAVCLNYDAMFPRPPRQVARPTWRETGGVYAVRASSFMDRKTRFCGKLGMFPVTARSAVDIDNEWDLTIAHAIAAEVYRKDAYREQEKARCAVACGSPEGWPGKGEPR